MQIIILGAPGAGKGTFAKKIKIKRNLTHISTGDLFRRHIKEETPLGLKAKEYISEGLLVPDELTDELVRHELEEIRTDFILDGYPRNIKQANALIDILTDYNITLDATIYIEIDEQVIIDRLVNRRVCSACGAIYNLNSLKPKNAGICDICGGELIQRGDDNQETIMHRLETYAKETNPLIDFYQKKNLLVKIDGNKELPEKYEELMNKLVERFEEE